MRRLKVRAVRDGSPSPYREPLPLPSRSENERRSPRPPPPNESTHELRATPAQARSHELTACRKRKEVRSAAALCYQRGRTDWGQRGKGGTKSDTLRRWSPPSRCRTCRPSRRSLLRVGGSEPEGLISGGIAEGESELDTPSHAAAATSKPAFVGLFMPADRGKEPRSRARRTLGAEHKGGLLEPSPLSEDDGSRRDRSGWVNSSGDIFYKNL